MRRVVLRAAGLVVAVSVLVAFGVLTFLRLDGARRLESAAAEIERVAGPVDPAAYQPPAVPASENAALPVLDAVGWLDAQSGEGWFRGEVGRLALGNHSAPEDWTADDWLRARHVVDAAGGLFGIVDRAAGRPRSSFNLDYSAGPWMEIPNLLGTLQVGNLLFARARIAWRDDDLEEAVRSVEALGAVRHVLEREPPLIFQLVGSAVETLQYRAIQEGLAVAGWDRLGAERLRRLRQSAGSPVDGERFDQIMGAEGATLHMAVSGGAMNAGRESNGGGSPLRWLRGFSHQIYAQRGAALGLGYYARIAGVYSDLTYAEMLERPELFVQPSFGGPSMVVGLEDSVGRLKGTEELGQLCRLALDLAMVGAQSGSLPEELPSGLDGGRGPFTGRAPLYRRSEDGSANLTMPGAEALWWDEVRSAVDLDDPPAPLFTWHLAPHPSGGTVPGV